MTSNTSKTMMYDQIPLVMKDFNIKNPVKNEYGSKKATISRSATDFSRPRFQMTKANDVKPRAPFGISKPYAKPGQDPAEVKDESDRKSVDFTIEEKGVYDALEALDAFFVDYAYENRARLFPGKTPSKELIANMYRPIVTLPKEGKDYKPTYRTKINLQKDSQYATRVFQVVEEDSKVKYVKKDSSLITSKSRYVPVVELSSLWFGAAQWGVTFELTDVIAYMSADREEFPFQLGDGVDVVPMDTDEVQQSSPQPMTSSGDNTTNANNTTTTTNPPQQSFTQQSAQPQQPSNQQSSNSSNGFVPPAAPY